MKKIKKNFIFLIFISIFFLIDRYSKNEILNILQNEKYLFINDFLNLNLVFNTGIGFGLFSLESGFLYHLISFLIFLIILVLLFLMIKSQFD